MDDRYTMIDDEALDDARRKMDAFQTKRGLIDALRLEALRIETQRLDEEIARQTPPGPRHSP